MSRQEDARDALAFAARVHGVAEDLAAYGRPASLDNLRGLLACPNGKTPAELAVALADVFNKMLADIAPSMGLTYDQVIAKLMDRFAGEAAHD